MSETYLEILDLRPEAGELVVAVAPDGPAILAAVSAAHMLTDRAFILLGRTAERAITIHVALKAGATEEETLRGLAAELEEEIRRTDRRRRFEVASRRGVEGVVIEALTGAPTHTSQADARVAMPYRYRQIGPDFLITNDFGEWTFLPPEDFERFAAGRVTPADPLFESLAARGFVGSALDHRQAVEALANRMSFLHSGPNLHIVVVTLRCDHTCRYCHASRVPMTRSGTDMTPEVAERVVETIFQTTSGFITIEFQGGEPLANWPTVQRIIEVAEELNRTAGKQLTFALVTNLSQMDEAKLDYLIAHRVEICSSLDGPADVHNFNRLTSDGDAFARAVEWIARINDRYGELGLDQVLYRVEALPTITRGVLGRWRELVDTYLANGCRSIYLRALNPFGFARQTAEIIGYSMDEWLEFYRHTVDYIIELNREGHQILERNAAIFLTKILCGADPNFLDIRSPCGAGIGQMAYNYDGSVFTCDEGRMMAQMGDDIFRMGDVFGSSYTELMRSEPVRALVMSSALDGQPGCIDCAYKPYCGTCPVQNYSEQGSLGGRMRESSWCKKHMGIMDYLFELLRRGEADPELRQVIERWTIMRPRTHFLHEADD